VVAAAIATYALPLLAAPLHLGLPPSAPLLQLVAITVIPSLLVYCWETEIRAQFVRSATGKNKQA
jgi:hypothetical protein